MLLELLEPLAFIFLYFLLLAAGSLAIAASIALASLAPWATFWVIGVATR